MIQLWGDQSQEYFTISTRHPLSGSSKKQAMLKIAYGSEFVAATIHL
jgi:hypothetical protein